MSISFSAVPASSIASGVFIEQEYKRSGPPGVIPQRVAVLAQYNSGKSPTNNVANTVTSADEAADLYGLGSMAHRIAIKLFNAIGAVSIGVDFFPLAAGTGSSTGTITVTNSATSAGTLAFYISGTRITVTVASGDTVGTIATAIAAAINAELTLPVTASAASEVVTLTAKWTGLSANAIPVYQNLLAGDSDASPATTTIAIVALSGGSADPSIATALTNFGGTFYTFVVLPFNTDTSLDLSEAAGDLRIGPSIKKPFAGIAGYNGTRTDFLTALGSRNSPWTTMIPVDTGPNHPHEIAASAVGAMVVSAASEPARPFKNLPLTGIMAGSVAPWTYAQRDAVEAAGGSSTYVDAGGIVRIHDEVTTYVTNALGAVDESWRFTCTITNVQAKIYSLDNMFMSAPFDRAVIVDDDAVTGKEFAVSPKRVKAYIIDLIDSQWIPEAWSKNRDDIVAGIVVEINASNASRIDVLIPDVIAVGLRIMAVKYQWSFAA